MIRINLLLSLCCFFANTFIYAKPVSEEQERFLERYKGHKHKVLPENALLNEEPEPSLGKGFTALYNGTNLDGWTPHGGTCNYEASGDVIIGTVVKGSSSTYLCTDKIYKDYIFTAEFYWEVPMNSGVMVRTQLDGEGAKAKVYGPQVEMEGPSNKGRNWSGGIFGQGIGGWRYPLWLEAHKEAREAFKPEEWNRITIKLEGQTLKTWINGVPATHWIDEKNEYPEGRIGLQVHSGGKGEVHYRNIKIKEL